jgi:hypothetical protein
MEPGLSASPPRSTSTRRHNPVLRPGYLAAEENAACIGRLHNNLGEKVCFMKLVLGGNLQNLKSKVVSLEVDILLVKTIHAIVSDH